MLDKTSRQFLRYLATQPNATMMFANYSSIPFSGDWPSFVSMLGYLADQQKIQYITNRNGEDVGVMLTHTARKSSEFYWIDFVVYLKDNWIAIVALIVSIIALVRSF